LAALEIQNTLNVLYDVGVDIIAMIVAAVLIFYVVREKFPKFYDAKILLISIYFTFEVILVLELASNSGVISSSQRIILSSFETCGETIEGVLLLSIAYVVYSRPSEESFSERLKALLTKRFIPHGAAIIISSVYAVFLIASILTTKPQVVTLTSIFGIKETEALLGGSLYLLAAPFAALIFLYTSPILFLAYQRTSPVGRTAMITFLASWLIVFIGHIGFTRVFALLGIEGREFAILSAAIAFIFTAISFRRVSIYEALFSSGTGDLRDSVNPFTSRMHFGIVEWEKPQLFEVDTSLDHESVLRDYVEEAKSKGYVVFVFTSKGSPIHKVMQGLDNVRFYLETSGVSYPKLGEHEHEMLIPVENALLLEAVENVVKSGLGGKVALVFDNISDLIVNLGFENTYKFLREALEIISGATVKGSVASLFSITHAGQEASMITMVRSLFSSHLLFDQEGLRSTR
jgi:hypothetical protein